MLLEANGSGGTTLSAVLKVLLLVLHVEDDENDRFFFGRAVQKLDLPIKVDVACDGEAVMRRLRSATAPPDIILADIRMPQMSGLELLAEIKKTEWSDVPVVIFSSSNYQGDIEAARKLGASGYRVKPHSQEELREFIQSLHERCELREAVCE